MKWLSYLMFFSSLNAIAGLADLKTINQDQLKLDASTKKVILVFWATWCPSCRQKLEDVLPHASLPADTKLFAVNTESEVEKVKRFIDKESIKTAVLFDLDKTLRREINQFKTPAWAVYKVENGKEILLKTESGFDKSEINSLVGAKVF